MTDEIQSNARKVAIIGAGVSGIAAAVHLRRAGLDVVVYERSTRVGGIWVYDQRTPNEASYPSTLPSTGDSPEYEALLERRGSRQDSPFSYTEDHKYVKDLSIDFAPPGPCYVALKNNVSTTEMELSCQKWKPETEDFVPHHQLAEYLQDTAKNNGVLEVTAFNTRVDRVEKTNENSKWKVNTSTLSPNGSAIDSENTEFFDAVVVANGNYHAVNIPDIPGLATWQRRYPSRIKHSKSYRTAEGFAGQNVLLIGAGVSSMDIARDLGNTARAVFQSSRGGAYDLSSVVLPENGARVDGIQSFDVLERDDPAEDGSIPGTITLHSGKRLCGIHQVIVCTGYHVSFPFLRQLHADGLQPEEADKNVLVTNGQQTSNLHKDIWYIPDPTLAFIGVPYHIATWSVFEFQAMALAATLAGKTSLPSRAYMRREYSERLERKGAGRPFHSLRAPGDEVAYVAELVAMVNSGKMEGEELVRGHSPLWIEAYARRGRRLQALFGQSRDPAVDERVLSSMIGC